MLALNNATVNLLVATPIARLDRKASRRSQRLKVAFPSPALLVTV
jgi:hypothetical protein